MTAYRPREHGEKPLTATFLVFLAIAWMAVLIPALVRAKRTAPLTTTERFKRGMEVLAAPPAPSEGRRVVAAPESAPQESDPIARVRKQRAVLFHLLVAAVPFTLAAAVLLDGGWWEIHIATDFTLALYVVGLLETKRRQAERRAKVRSITRRRTSEGFDEVHAFGGR